MATAVKKVELPLIVIVGPTASGKSSVALELAEKFNGEIICADSRTIYTGMDIGTAKPTKAEQERVPHWGIDLVEPGGRFTAADFKEYANKKIAEIRTRGRVPFLVGGTGLYIDAVLFDFEFGGDRDPAYRQKLEKMTTKELQEYCIKNYIALPENTRNKRHLVRTIEQKGSSHQRRRTPISSSIIVGIATNKRELQLRIEERSEQILTNGVVGEAIILGKKYGWKSEAMTGNIYPLLLTHIEEDYSLAQVQADFTTLDWRLAKRQLTWFRRNSYIVWLTRSEVGPYLSRVLAT